MIKSPCASCKRQADNAARSCMCNKWIDWFRRIWPQLCQEAREKWGHPDGGKES